MKFRKTLNEELERKSIKEFKNTQKLPVVLVLDNVRSMHNVGSAFRTADAFLVEKILLTGITACPPHREIHKTALGATESVEWHFEKNTMDAILPLKEAGYTIISVEQAEPNVGLDLFEPILDRKYCLVFGNEINGIEDAVLQASDICLEIPQHGTKHSLNISVSIGVVLWRFFQKLML